jgi:hypothetical protein
MTNGNGTKKWYKSKMLWVNALALLALLVQVKYGFVIDPVEQAAALTIVNLILRAVTGTGLEFRSS